VRAQAVHTDAETVQAVLPGQAQITARNGNCTQASAPCLIAIRPEKLGIALPQHNPDNRIQARFITRHYVGDFIRNYFALEDGSTLTVKTLNDTHAPQYEEGQMATLGWMTTDCFAFTPEPASGGEQP